MSAEDASSSEEEEESKKGDQEDDISAEKDAIVVNEEISDLEYLRSRMTGNFDEASESDQEQVDEDIVEEDEEAEGAYLLNLSSACIIWECTAC